MTQPEVSNWPEGGGKLGALIRKRAGSERGLGPISSWPQSLRTSVDIVLHLSTPAVLFWGSEGYTIYNDAYSELVGALHPTLLGSRITEHDAANVFADPQILSRVLAGESLVERDREFTFTRDGNEEASCLTLEYSPVCDESGRPAGTLTLVFDSIERVRAERARTRAEQSLRASEIIAELQRAEALEAARTETEEERKRFARVFDQAPFPVSVLLGPALVFASCNEMHRRLLGKLDVRGLPLRHAFPESVSKPFVEIVEQVYRTGRPVSVSELPLGWDRVGNGSMSHGFFDVLYQPLREANGQVEGVIVLVVEMTESVRARRSVDAARSAAEAARTALERVQDDLELRIKERTAELALTNSALAAEIAERVRAERIRTDLLRRLASAQEDEQRRIARDLHDQVGQTLTALTLAVRAARTAEPLSQITAQRLSEVQSVAEELGRQVHGLAVRLRPTALDDLGLYAALSQLLSDWSSRAGVEVDFQAAGLESGRLPPEVETAVYRVVQETLTNVARHARAKHVSVIVERHDGHAITMVEDDGIGFIPEAGSARLGLVGMRERVTLVGGKLDVESSEGQGTTVIARIPLRAENGLAR